MRRTGKIDTAIVGFSCSTRLILGVAIHLTHVFLLDGKPHRPKAEELARDIGQNPQRNPQRCAIAFLCIKCH